MKILAAIVAACVAALVVAATTAHATPGTPIQGTPVGLDWFPPPDPFENAVTNDKGIVIFINLKPGRYAVSLPETSKFKAPVRVVITSGDGKNTFISEPIVAGKAGAKALCIGQGRSTARGRDS